MSSASAVPNISPHYSSVTFAHYISNVVIHHAGKHWESASWWAALSHLCCLPCVWVNPEKAYWHSQWWRNQMWRSPTTIEAIHGRHNHTRPVQSWYAGATGPFHDLFTWAHMKAKLKKCQCMKYILSILGCYMPSQPPTDAEEMRYRGLRLVAFTPLRRFSFLESSRHYVSSMVSYPASCGPCRSTRSLSLSLG